MKLVIGWFAAIVVLVFAVPSFAQQGLKLGELSAFEFELRRFRANLVSELRLSGPGVVGTDFDPVADLGLPPERTFDYHFGVRLTRRLKVRGNWFRTRYESDLITGRDLLISGAFFPSATTVTSMVELEQRRGGVEFDVFTGAYGYVAVIGEWSRFQAKNTYRSNLASASPSTLRMDLPVFGAKSRVYLTPALALTGEAVGMKRESTGVMTDVDIAVTYNAIPNFALSYGYRNAYNRFKDGEPDTRAIYRLRGQYFGITVRF